MKKTKRNVVVYGLSLNSQDNVQDWLRCTKGASRRFVCDLGSTDDTVELLKKEGVKVFRQKDISLDKKQVGYLKNFLLERSLVEENETAISVNVDVWETVSSNFINDAINADSNFLAFPVDGRTAFENRGARNDNARWNDFLAPTLNLSDGNKPMLLRCNLRKQLTKDFGNYILEVSNPKSKNAKELIFQARCLLVNEDHKNAVRRLKKASRLAKRAISRAANDVERQSAVDDLVNSLTLIEKSYYQRNKLIGTLRAFNKLAKLDGKFRTPYVYVALVLSNAGMHSYALSVIGAMQETEKRHYETELPNDLYSNIPQALLVHTLWITGEKDEAVKGYNNLSNPKYFENKYPETAEELLKYSKEKK